MQVAAIYGPVQESMERIEAALRTVGSKESPFLARLLEHVFDTTGKRLRPALTLLASGFHPHEGREPETMGVAVELLHIATLIHDDTVDSSDVRRGKATIGRLWGGNTAVLVGDYIFAASATHVCDTGDIRVIRRFAETIMELSSGELQEMAASYDCGQTRDQYFDRIYKKTASLFVTSGESGAILSGAPEEVVRTLKEYSRNLGMAFQIADDILDFEGTEAEVGKPVGNDLAQGIVTLPAIIAMERSPGPNPIADLFERPQDESRLKRSIEMILDTSAIDASYARAREFGDSALAALEHLPRNDARNSLEELVEYVLRRHA